MNIVVGTSSFTVREALTYENGDVVDITDLVSLSLWVRSGRGRYKGSYQLTTNGRDGRLSFDLDATDLDIARGEKVKWQYEVKTAAGQVIWTEANTITLVPRS